VPGVWIGSEARRKHLCEGGGWTAAPEVIWNRHCLAGRKEVLPVLLAATSTLSPSDLLAPLAAAVALLLPGLVGRPAPVWVWRRNNRRR
jgi:hypothetical protein